ncbi:MAG: hypothetical protein AAF581_19145 [Planctomycetota bacterium]
MIDSLKNVLLTGLGAVSFSQEKLKSTVSDLISRGDLTREQGEKVLSEWLERGKEDKEKVFDKFSDESKKMIEKLGLVSKTDFEALQARVDELEKKLAGEG